MLILNNIKMLLGMLADRKFRANSLMLHQRFSQNPRYQIRNLLRCAAHVIKNERLALHDGMFIVNSFLPPINSTAYERIAIRVPGEGAEFYESHVSGIRTAPISVYIAVTSRCMYKCWHCSAKQMMEEHAADLSTAELKKIVRDAQELGIGIIGFTGGEPLLREDLEEVVASMDDGSMRLLFTNGFGLTKERASALKAAGLFGVGISIDSIHEKIHDEKRGYAGAYKIALEAIKQAKAAGLYTMAQVVCTKNMLLMEEIHQIARMLKTLGIHELRILEPIPCGMLAKDEEHKLTKREKEQLIDLHRLFNHYSAYPKTSVFPYIESEDQFGCGAGIQHSYIDDRGNFRPCDFIYKDFGNVLDEPIADIWQRMHQSAGKPKCGCLAKQRTVIDDSPKLPKYYRLLKGDKE